MATTIIKSTYNIKEIFKIVVWHGLPQEVKDFLKSYDEFRITNHGKELLVYDGNQVVASCGLYRSGLVDHVVFHIENIWTKEGKLF